MDEKIIELREEMQEIVNGDINTSLIEKPYIELFNEKSLHYIDTIIQPTIKDRECQYIYRIFRHMTTAINIIHAKLKQIDPSHQYEDIQTFKLWKDIEDGKVSFSKFFYDMYNDIYLIHETYNIRDLRLISLITDLFILHDKMRRIFMDVYKRCCIKIETNKFEPKLMFIENIIMNTSDDLFDILSQYCEKKNILNEKILKLSDLGNISCVDIHNLQNISRDLKELESLVINYNDRESYQICKHILVLISLLEEYRRTLYRL